MGLNVIADIAGRFDELLLLLDKMPADPVLSVGDMCDRGSQSKQVVEWFMNNGKALLGNHEHFCVDTHQKLGLYEEGLWIWNGGGTTLESFDYQIPDEVITWMSRLPLYTIYEDFFIAHSFQHPNVSLKDSCEVWVPQSLSVLDKTIIWNRSHPIPRDKYQIAGHDSQFGCRTFSKDGTDYATCIDASRDRVLTGIHLPDRRIYQQRYLDKE